MKGLKGNYEEIDFQTRKIYIYSKIRDTNNINMFLVQDGQDLKVIENNIIGKLDKNLDNLMVVFIASQDRNSDYSPWYSESIIRSIPYFKGEGDSYLDLVINRIKPFVQRRYNIRVRPENTFLIGSSLGGLIATYGLIKYPRDLGGGGFISPSYWYPGFIDFINSSNLSFSRFKIYLDVGQEEGAGKITWNKDMHSVVLEVKNILRAKGLREEDLTYVVHQDMVHNSSYFLDRIYDSIFSLMTRVNL